MAGQYSAGTLPRVFHIATALWLNPSRDASAAWLPQMCTARSSESMAPFNHERNYRVNTNVISASGVITLVKKQSSDLSTLAGRLRHARERVHWTQQQLADAAGVSQSTIGNLESQTRYQPRDLLTIASALGVSAVWLDKGEGDMLVENSRLRPDVKELAQLVQERLSEYQVARIKEMVIAFEPDPVDGAPTVMARQTRPRRR